MKTKAHCRRLLCTGQLDSFKLRYAEPEPAYNIMCGEVGSALYNTLGAVAKMPLPVGTGGVERKLNNECEGVRFPLRCILSYLNERRSNKEERERESKLSWEAWAAAKETD
jgi:hypothetical protein